MHYLVFKPDGIGDFVLATGAIRLLADEVGEDHLTLVVLPPVRPLAESQFPKAMVIDLPMAKKRKILNVFIVNFLNCLPARRQMRVKQNDAALSLRAMRAYLHTFLFFSTRTKHFYVCENLLTRNKRWSRRFVEWLTRTLFAPHVSAYPETTEGIPSELEAHRRVLSLALKREITIADILPRLQVQPVANPPEYWLCCPLSAIPSKNYPFENWLEVFQQNRDLIGSAAIWLTGSIDQKSQLEELATLLKKHDFANVQIELRPTLQGFIELVDAAKWVLTIDTAAAHMACALNKRCLILFSGLLRGMFGPWTRSSRQVWLDPLPPPGGKSRKWFRDMPPAHVTQALHQLADVE